MSTNIVKWNDTTNQLTAYCDDDKTKTEIGPAKWNDVTNQLEIHCDGNVYPVKWNDTENRLEARNVSADCCCEYTNNCTDCYATDQTPAYMKVTFTGVTDCGAGSCDWLDGDFFLGSDGRYNCVWSNGTSPGDGNAIYMYLNYSGKVYVTAFIHFLYPPFYYCFSGDLLVDSCDDNDSSSNTMTVGECTAWSAAYGGTVSWEPSCNGS